VASKLTIPGVIELEGGDDLIREIYADISEKLKESLGRQSAPEVTSSPAYDEAFKRHSNDSDDKKSKTPVKKPTRAKVGAAAPRSDYKPKFKSDLNLRALESFFKQHEVRNHSDKILLFSIFLKENMKIEPCSADDIYSCYFTLKGLTKIPEAFVQALRDAQNRFGFIEFRSLDHVETTIAGLNHYQDKLQKKTEQ
jgi:hypothetical protein